MEMPQQEQVVYLQQNVNYQETVIAGTIRQVGVIEQPQDQIIPKEKLTYEEALALVDRIPDSFSFRHEYAVSTPFLGSLFGGNYRENSSFKLPGLGKLIFGSNGKRACCCCGNITNTNQNFAKRFGKSRQYFGGELASCCCQHFNNTHYFSYPTYLIENDKISIQFQDKVGKLFVYGVLLLEFIQCENCMVDRIAGSAQSTMPQMVVYNPFHYDNNKMRVKAQMNKCPEHPYQILGICQSIGGLGKRKLINLAYTERMFEIDGLSNPNAKCSIRNIRTYGQACCIQCGCSQICICDNCQLANFPEFIVGFSECTQLEKLAVLMCLLHFNMYNCWEETKYQGRFLIGASSIL